MLMAIVVIAVLAALLLPALAKAKSAARSVQCVNNLMQLQKAWMMYADDNDDTLPFNKWMTVNFQDTCPEGVESSADSWVLGNTTQDLPTSWNIRNGSLFPYVGDATVYHCPADTSTLDRNDRYRYTQRSRSYSLSFYMNGNRLQHYPQVKARLGDIAAPSDVFVFLDEHEMTINDGVFFLHGHADAGEQDEAEEQEEAGSSPEFRGAHWMQLPSDRHNQGCNISYADGSVHHRKWLGRKIYHPQADKSYTDVTNAADLQDYRWLQSGIPQPGNEWCGLRSR